MIKTLSIAISAMVVLLVSLFSDPVAKITITSNVQPHLVPGEDCLVQVTIHKGKTTGYARMQQILPFGLKATAVEIAGAKFEMEDNVVKFIWQDLPVEDAITVSYKIQTDPNEMEIKSVPGTFYYVENNLITKTEMEPVLLNFTSQSGSASNAEVERKIIAVTPESGDYKVELTIHKKQGEHAAKFTDNIPEGYTVSEVQSNGANYQFNNGQAVFQWTTLPETPTMNISYRLNATTTQAGKPQVTGMLVYGDENIPQQNSSTADPVAASATEEAPAVAMAATDAIASNLASQEKAKADAIISAFETTSQPGVFYKIQIAATRKSPLRTDQYFENKYHIGQHVDLAEQDGWRKYMIGNFDTYGSAATFSQRTKEKFPDAFVVAYRNAERITIKEAMSGVSRAD